jgi:hypothetical protein
MGRPTKLTDAVTKTITDAIAKGLTYEAAADLAGITRETFNQWMKDGRPRFKAFSDAVRQANAQARIQLIEKIGKADDWRAAAWILERRFREEYGANVQLRGDKDAPLEVRSFDYATAVAPIADGPEPDRDAPGQDQGDRDGPALGQDDDGG